MRFPATVASRWIPSDARPSDLDLPPPRTGKWSPKAVGKAAILRGLRVVFTTLHIAPLVTCQPPSPDFVRYSLRKNKRGKICP